MGSGLSSPALEQIDRLLDDLAAEPLMGIDGEQLVRLQRIQDRLGSEFVRRLGVFDREKGAANEGCISTQAWLRWRCHLANGAASIRVRMARQLRELPGTREAFAAGRITFSHAANIARTSEQLGTEAVAAAEPILLEAACKVDAGRFGYVTRYLRNTLDPDGSLADANDLHDRNYLQLSQSWEGRWFLEGRLDAETGAVVDQALSALTPPRAEDDRRSGCSRRAAALFELARQALDGGQLPRKGGQKPHLVITASAATLRRDAGTGPAELEGAGPIHAESARRLACDCAFSVIVIDSDGTPLEVGREKRSIPPALKRALVLRDRGCRFPGCDRPARWCDGHHLVHRIDGGDNKLANLVLLCRRHHRLVHEGGWRVSWGPDGKLEAQPPSSRPP